MPYSFSQPFTSKAGNVSLKIQFAQVETFSWYSIKTNARIWSLSISNDDVSYTSIDSRSLSYTNNVREFQISAVTCKYVNLNITRVIDKDPFAQVYSLVFFDEYKRRIIPYLTQNSKYYTCEYTTYVQPGIQTDAAIQSGETGPVRHFIFPVPVSPDYVYGPTVRRVNVGGQNVSTGSNNLSVAPASTDVYVYYKVGQDPTSIKLFDVNCAPLTDSNWYGGPIRYGRDEWVEVRFATPISANSYSFTTPDIDIYPTWFQVQGYDNDWRTLDERKHQYAPYTRFSSLFTTNLKPYNRYRIVIKAMRQKTNRSNGEFRPSAELTLFNLYDMNGCEFVKTLTFTNDGRTNAQILERVGFIENTITTSSEWIRFIVPVKIVKIIVNDLIGQISISCDDSTTQIPISNQLTLTNITGQRINVNVPSSSRYSSIEFHGTKGRLNPYISSDGTIGNVYGGKTITDQTITVILPSNQTLEGNHYYISTTDDVCILSYKIYGFRQGSRTELDGKENIYPLTSKIQGNFTNTLYDRYELQILEISPNKYRRSVDISDLTIFSSAYIPIIPQFVSDKPLKVTIPELPLSLHGVYTINPLNTSATFQSWSNLFDGSNTTVFIPTNSKTSEFTLTFPYPVVITGGVVTGNQTHWALYGTDNRLLLSGTTQTVYNTSQTFEYVTVRFTALTNKENLEIVDVKLFNQSGEFIPRIVFTNDFNTSSTKDQWIYGGYSQGQIQQTITATFPDSQVLLQSIEFTGTSLPSNIVVRTDTSFVMQGDTYFGPCIYYNVSGVSSNKYIITINRLRSNTSRIQRIDINDIIFRDANGYQVTPLVFPTYDSSTLTKKIYTIIEPTRKGYRFTNAPSQSSIVIDKLPSFSGYRGKFIGVKEMRVLTGTTVIHEMQFATPFGNTFSYSNTSVSLTDQKVKFEFLSTFEGYDKISLGNFNIYNTYGEPYLNINVSSTASEVFRAGGGCSRLNLIKKDLVGETVTFEYPDTSIVSKKALITTTYPAECIVLVTDDFITYQQLNTKKLEFGTYISNVSGSDLDMFIGKTTVFKHEQVITLRFPRSFRVNTLTLRVPITFTTTSISTYNNANKYVQPGEIQIFSINTVLQEISLQCKYIGSISSIYSIGISDVLINGDSLGEFGIVDGNIITYYRPTTSIIEFTGAHKHYIIKCLSYYNDKNSGDGTITFKNTTIQAVNNNNFFNGFISNTYETYGFNDDEVVTSNTPVYLQMDRSMTVYSPDTFIYDTSYSQIVSSHLEYYDGSNWRTVGSYPVSAPSFRRVVDSIINFKQNGRIKIMNWSLNGYPSILGTMTSNTLVDVEVIEQPSFGATVTTLTVSSL